MTKKSNKEVIENFFKDYTAAEVDQLLWKMFLSLHFSSDFECWPAEDKMQVANLYKNITGLINNLEESTLKSNL